MKRSSRLIILIGIFLAIVAFMAVVLMAQGGGNNAPAAKSSTPPPNVSVVVAKSQIPVGQKITADMLQLKTMTTTERDALGGDTYSNIADVVNKTAGATIASGQAILASRSFMPYGQVAQGTDFAPSIASGFVAVTMEVDQINGVGTLLVPGDRVDLILATYPQPLKITGNKTARGTSFDLGGQAEVTAKMVIQNRKILAVMLPSPTASSQPTAAAPSASAQPSANTVTNNGQHMIVMIEVKPDEAEVIRWAQRAEKQDAQNYLTLGLALRSDQDNSAANVTTVGTTFRILVDKWGVMPPDPRGIIPADLMALIQF